MFSFSFHHKVRVARAAAIGLALTLPAVAIAQPSSPGDPSRVATINPFIVLLGYFSGEYEHRISPSLSLGVAGSSISFGDEDRRNNLDAKVRLYPNERALHGFGLGASLGWTQLRKRDYLYPVYPACENNPGGCEPSRVRNVYSAPSIAIEISYQWLLGTRKSTAIVVGGGAKRAFVGKEDWDNNQRIVPTGRLSVGYAF